MARTRSQLQEEASAAKKSSKSKNGRSASNSSVPRSPSRETSETSEPPKKQSKKKVPKKSPRELRLLEVEDMVQQAHNVSFRNGDFTTIFKFRIGDGIIAFSDGLYYEGNVMTYYRMKAPDSLYDASEKVHFDKQIPTYWIRFSGWTKKFDEEVPENELTSREPNVLLNVFGMLYAHEWNEFRRILKNRTQKQMGIGSWFLTENDYKILEERWQAETGNTVGFAEFCGSNLTMAV